MANLVCIFANTDLESNLAQLALSSPVPPSPPIHPPRPRQAADCGRRPCRAVPWGDVSLLIPDQSNILFRFGSAFPIPFQTQSSPRYPAPHRRLPCSLSVPSDIHGSTAPAQGRRLLPPSTRPFPVLVNMALFGDLAQPCTCTDFPCPLLHFAGLVFF